MTPLKGERFKSVFCISFRSASGIDIEMERSTQNRPSLISILHRWINELHSVSTQIFREVIRFLLFVLTFFFFYFEALSSFFFSLHSTFHVVHVVCFSKILYYFLSAVFFYVLLAPLISPVISLAPSDTQCLLITPTKSHFKGDVLLKYYLIVTRQFATSTHRS